MKWEIKLYISEINLSIDVKFSARTLPDEALRPSPFPSMEQGAAAASNIVGLKLLICHTWTNTLECLSIGLSAGLASFAGVDRRCGIRMCIRRSVVG
jgi:hypothetical protein